MAALPLETRQEILDDFDRLSKHKPLQHSKDPSALIQETAELFRDSYDSCIAAIDDQFGRLFDALESRRLLENTLVIITSDHGEHFNDRHLFGHGNSLYRPLLHVPLLIFPPGKDRVRGQVVTDPVSLGHLPATINDLLGCGNRSPLPGRSLARYWAGPPGPPRPEALLAEVEHQTVFPPSPHIPASLGPLQAIVADSRVYIFNQGNGREEIYDLATDPHETHDLVATEPEAAPPLLSRYRDDLERLLQR